MGITYFAFDPPSPHKAEDELHSNPELGQVLAKCRRQKTAFSVFPLVGERKDWPEFGQVLCPPPWLVRTSDVGRTEI